MTSDRLKTDLWVKAQIRICDLNNIPAFIGKKGDPDAGSVLLKLNRFASGCTVLVPVTTMEGGRGWMHALKEGYTNERDVDAYIARQVERDPDVWVLEIEDPKSQYDLDGPMVT